MPRAMPARRPLVLGADGGIGAALVEVLSARGGRPLTTSRRNLPHQSADSLHLDLGDDLRDWAPPEGVDVAFVCAAVTATDQCRRDPTATRRVNVENTVLLAQALVRAGCFVIFPSTNLVFDGSKPCCASLDQVCPRAEYGRQKAEAESRLLALGQGVAVLRLSKVLTPTMPLLVRWKGELSQNRPVAPFHDMVMAPVPLALTVEAFLGIAAARSGGVWQLSATKDVSYSQVALDLCRRLGASESLVRAVSWREASPTLEHVPAHTTLDSSRLEQELGLAAPAPAATLDQVLGGMK